MKRRELFGVGLAVALIGAKAPTLAQQPAAAKSALEPAAMDALQKMGAYLRTLKAFQVEAAVTDEDVLEDGQKDQYAGVTSILARMPNGLVAEVKNDRRDRTFVYDGKSFTLFAKRLGYYATIDAPPTIGQLADMLEEKHGFGVPLADLFRWGGASWSAEGIKAATDLGSGVVEGTTCQHYGFRQAEIDWQVWIQKGDYPLPRKLVITTITDEARPQHTAVFTWNLAPSYNDAAFTFDPPEGAGKVVLAKAAGTEK